MRLQFKNMSYIWAFMRLKQLSIHEKVEKYAFKNY